MLATRTDDPQVEIDRYALDAVARWLRDEMLKFSREQLATFFVKLLGALVVAAVLHVVLILLMAQVFDDGNLMVMLLVAPEVPLMIGFVVQAFVHRKAYGVMLVHGRRIRFADEHSVIRKNDDDLPAQAVGWVLIPAWLFFSAFESLAHAWRLRRAKPELCAEILANLAAFDRRVPVQQIEHHYPQKDLAPTIRGLLAFPGVLVSDRAYPRLLLSRELGDTVRRML